MANSELKSTFLKSLLFGCALALLVLLFYSRTLILAGMTGLGLGCLASPFLNFLRKKAKIPRALGALILIFLLVLVFSGMFYAAGSLMADQIQNLQEQLPSLLSRAENSWRNLTHNYPLLQERLNDLSFGESAKAGVSRLIHGLGSGINALTGFVLAFFIALYTAIHAEEYFKGWLNLFSKKHQGRVQDLSLKSAKVLRAWFSAQLIDMALVGIITAFGLWLIGATYWALFGLMTALLAVIPYFGVLITLIFATFVTGAEQPDLVLWVLLVFFITQQIEGNLILPIIMKERVKLAEAPLLFFIVLMSFWFGIPGIIVAPGMFAIGKTLYQELTYNS
ncbi:MAG: hypothetical protein CL676_06575 [Bdellovibrionaceae bacterium]|nr:hypothetical protein [Pseudobdellovibrionaceae bacterium]|tara:strand:+ start:268 stop:1275 length:1008 start_codon:yes stop_codon:yes gene_type:complete